MLVSPIPSSLITHEMELLIFGSFYALLLFLQFSIYACVKSKTGDLVKCEIFGG